VNRHNRKLAVWRTELVHTLFWWDADRPPAASPIAPCPKPGTARPAIVWLGGFKSDMRGSRRNISTVTRRRRAAPICVSDYSGHGASEGRFEAEPIGAWLEESLAAIRALTEGPQILVGSSMGGWLALLAARHCTKALKRRGSGPCLDRPRRRLHRGADLCKDVSRRARGAASERDVAARFGLLARALSGYKGADRGGPDHLLLGGAIRAYCLSIFCKACATKMSPGRTRWRSPNIWPPIR